MKGNPERSANIKADYQRRLKLKKYAKKLKEQAIVLEAIAGRYTNYKLSDKYDCSAVTVQRAIYKTG